MTAVDISKNVQKEPWFLEINPNGRIPALTDKFADGTTIRLFESGSILQYLVDRYDTEHKVSYPQGSKEYFEVNNWVGLPSSPSSPGEVRTLTDCVALLADGRSGAHARPSQPLFP